MQLGPLERILLLYYTSSLNSKFILVESEVRYLYIFLFIEVYSWMQRNHSNKKCLLDYFIYEKKKTSKIISQIM